MMNPELALPQDITRLYLDFDVGIDHRQAGRMSFSIGSQHLVRSR